MKFKKTIILLIAAIILNTVQLHAMEPIAVDGKKEKNSKENLIAPYVNAAASFAVARYVPDIASAVMPRLAPNSQLAATLVPSAIKFGGYGLTVHFLLKKGLGINYSDLMKRPFLEKVAVSAAKISPLALCYPQVIEAVRKYGTSLATTHLGSSAAKSVHSYASPAAIATGALASACMINPNLAPATLCHPEIAQLVAKGCTSLATSYVSERTVESLNKYMVPAVMAAGALSTLYLVDRNVFHGQLLKKVKRIYKDAKPYLFVGPLATAYNADAIKNYAMQYTPLTPGSNLHSDLGAALKATIYWGSLATAAYLFTTEMLDIANQGYFQRKTNKLLNTCNDLYIQFKQLLGEMDAELTVTGLISQRETLQTIAITKLSTDLVKSMHEREGLLKAMSEENTKSSKAVAALEQIYTNISDKAKKISVIAPQIAENLEILKEEHAKNIEKLRTQMGAQSDEVLAVITQEEAKLEAQIMAIEAACKDEPTDLEVLEIKLQEFLGLLTQEGQIYHFDQQRIKRIGKALTNSTQSIEAITKELVQPVGETQKK